MKSKLKFSALLFIFFTIILSSCNNSNDKKQNIEDLIIGKWYQINNSEIEEVEEGLELSTEVESEYEYFKENNKFEENTLVKYLIYYQTQTFTASYSLKLSGTWKLEDYKISVVSDIKSIKTRILNNTATNRREREFVEALNQNFSSSMKETIIENDNEPFKIISIDENSMQMKDNEGTIYKSKRIGKSLSKTVAKVDKDVNTSQTYYNENQLRTAQTLWEKVLSRQNPDESLGFLVPQKNSIDIYSNPNLTGSPVYSFIPRQNQTKSDRAFIVFDLIQSKECEFNYKVLTNTGHLGWISGCSDITKQYCDTKLATINKNKPSWENSEVITILKSIYNTDGSNFIESNN